jgi:hypothetical protein
MPQPNLKSRPWTDRIILAIQAIKSDALLSLRRAAAVYNVPETTLRRQRAKPASNHNTHHNGSKLQRHEEEATIQSIKKLNARGFAPTLSYVREMANQLLAVRGGSQVRENWTYRLVRRRPEIKS